MYYIRGKDVSCTCPLSLYWLRLEYNTPPTEGIPANDHKTITTAAAEQQIIDDKDDGNSGKKTEITPKKKKKQPNKTIKTRTTSLNKLKNRESIMKCLQDY